MSALALCTAEAEERSFWVSSDTVYLRLVTERRTTEGEVTEFESGGVSPWSDTLSFSIALSTENELRCFLESRLKSIPEVVRVKIAERRTRKGAPALHVWSSLSRDDRATRFKLYDVEQELVDHFPELVLEFHSHLEREDAPDGDTVVYEPPTT